MKVELTPIEGCKLITPKRFADPRGLFWEGYHKERYLNEAGISADFIQDNNSVSVKGVLRGLHFQTGAYAQSKLVQVIKGEVQDVVVDLRADSPTYLQTYSVVLNEENGHQLFVPAGCAHGFLCLSDQAVFSYKCDAYYHPASEAGIHYKDPDLKIKWHLPEEELLLSDKDLELPTLKTWLSHDR